MDSVIVSLRCSRVYLYYTIFRLISTPYVFYIIFKPIPYLDRPKASTFAFHGRRKETRSKPKRNLIGGDLPKEEATRVGTIAISEAWETLHVKLGDSILQDLD